MIRFHSAILTVRRYTTSVRTGRLAEIPKAYDPTEFEAKVGKKWAKRKRYTVEELNQDKSTFRMIFPPPNVTGKLHLGHALTVAIQDTIVRLKLMRGHKVEWIPGFDHAGIATHSVVTRKLAKLDESKDPGRLNEELENHAVRQREIIRNQLTSLGALLDSEREYYTLDENHSFVVKEAFMHLFENGIIRRGDGLVNWSFALGSSIADIEVDQVEFKGRREFQVPGYSRGVEVGLLYYCAYPVHNSKNQLVVATSRPETMFGDAAVAVNPNDSKNSDYIGKSVVNPINGKLLNVIGDDRVKPNFGTGAVKITPAHDTLDFAIGIDHHLASVKIFDSDGNMNSDCGIYEGIPRFTARRKVISYLKDCGALIDVKEYNGSIRICSRTQDIIEPMLLPHWFFQTSQFTQAITNFINQGEVIVRPKHMQEVFLHQLSIMHDWCLSRQIKWGHEIPAYYHQDFPEQWVTASDKSTALAKLNVKLGTKMEDETKVCQDADVLDTWFSSALIPVSLSNWPELDDFKEISLMETGHDILFFWVWRMMIMNLALTKKLPFKSVLLHGVVVDSYGRKMSKSKGNVLDPMHIIEGREIEALKSEANRALQSGELTLYEFDLRMDSLGKDFPNGLPPCGADALRFALLGQDLHDVNVTISLDYLENCKHFCNKLWQAMRMFLHYNEMSRQSDSFDKISNTTDFSKLPMMDRWILAVLFDFVKNYEIHVRDCKFHLVTEIIRSFFYQQYCDVYLEFVKLELKNSVNVELHLGVMHFVLCTTLKMAHPFLPFVTEEVWSVLNENYQDLLVDTRQPSVDDLAHLRDEELVQRVEKLLKVIKQVRSFKGKFFPGIKHEPTILIEVHQQDQNLIEAQSYIESLTRVKLTFDILGKNSATDSLGIIFDLEGGRSCRISCSRSDPSLVLPNVEPTKLAKMEAALAKLRKQYDSPTFQEKAPEEAKEKLRRKLQALHSRIETARHSSSTQPSQWDT